MRLDTSYLAYITKDELRVLLAVEMGMRNHEYVPGSLIEKISKVKRANAFVILQNLLKNKLVTHTKQKYDGYKLTYLGYDYLALSVFYKRGSITKVLTKIGVGKESDIYRCQNSDGNIVVLKLARLGRTSFRTVKKNRDYLQHRTQYNWLYLSRLASVKEFAYMEALYKNGFPTPTPIDWNRHGIVMSIINGYTLCNVASIQDANPVFKQCVELLEKFAQFGLIHSDLNEFNLMITDDLKIRVIDFPQMVSTSHLNADYYFQRDLDCLNTFFHRKFKCDEMAHIELNSIQIEKKLDLEVKASGFVKKELHKENDLDYLDEYQKNQEKEDSENEIEEGEQDSSQDDHSQRSMEISQEELSDIESQEQTEKQEIKQESKQELQQEQEQKQEEDQQEVSYQINKKKQQIEVPKQELTELDTRYIKKVVKKKYRNKQHIKKNNNKNKEVDIEERIQDIYL